MAYSTITKPSLHFNTKLYTGNASTQAITGVGFQPDWTWIKNRSTGNAHVLVDAVRGVDKTIFTNANNAEQTGSTNIGSFDTDGFTLGSNGGTNGSGNSIVSWNWKANGAGSANSDGSVSSTVSVNTTAGLSIVTWTSLASGSNYTVGHGLGSTPGMIIIKTRHEVNNWLVYHHKSLESLPETDYLVLDEDGATSDYPIWNDTAPTSSVFTCGTWSGFDAGGTMIAYCFAEKKGYSKFGSYTGNGNDNGPFIYTGFKPAWTMIKRTDSSSDWNIMDNKRAVSFNPNTKELYANTNGVEATGGETIRDYLSNGFKLRGTSGGTNASSGRYVYMAFAEEPLVANVGESIPATAR